MSNTRKLRTDPMLDEIAVIYPDVGQMLAIPEDQWDAIKPASITEQVTRGEFIRRMAGTGVDTTLAAAGRNVRVIALAEPDAIIRWHQTRPVN